MIFPGFHGIPVSNEITAHFPYYLFKFRKVELQRSTQFFNFQKGEAEEKIAENVC